MSIAPAAGVIAGIVASSLLAGLCTHFAGSFYVLAFVAFTPWLRGLDGVRSPWAAVAAGYLMAVAFVAAIFTWFGFAMAVYSEGAVTIGIVVLLLAAPLLQPQFLPFALVRHLGVREYGPVLGTIAAACAWVATERLFPKLLGDNLAEGIYPSPRLRQFADLGGTAGITFAVLLINECVARAIARRQDGVPSVVKPLAVAVAMVAAMSAYGTLRLAQFGAPPTADETHLRVGLVQANIASYERLRREIGTYDVVRYVLDTHYEMSRAAIAQHDVEALLWSETVYPTTFGHPKSAAGAELDQELIDFVARAGVPLLFGSYDTDRDGEYNAAVLLHPTSPGDGARHDVYRKTNPFLFTEYVPAWLDGPWLRAWLPWAGTWRAGTGARVLPLRLRDGREVPVLPLICLDDVDTQLALDGARQGARLLLVMSNDSWFSERPAGAQLHLMVSAFRSIETRLPQLRVTANGVSAVIDATGDVIAAAGMDERKLLIGEARLRAPTTTLMMILGDWIGVAAGAVLIALAVHQIALRVGGK